MIRLINFNLGGSSCAISWIKCHLCSVYVVWDQTALNMARHDGLVDKTTFHVCGEKCDKLYIFCVSYKKQTVCLFVRIYCVRKYSWYLQ
jgi:hypothetical protein